MRLIAVDTLTRRQQGRLLPDERIARLLDLIDRETTKPVAVFTHHPPFEVLSRAGSNPFRKCGSYGAAAPSPAAFRADRRHFSGHVHRAGEGFVGPIPASVVPCIATSLRRGHYPQAMKTRPVYHIHQFDPAWGFTTATRIVQAQNSGAAPHGLARSAASSAILNPLIVSVNR